MRMLAGNNSWVKFRSYCSILVRSYYHEIGGQLVSSFWN
jgi:hypothetical protein